MRFTYSHALFSFCAKIFVDFSKRSIRFHFGFASKATHCKHRSDCTDAGRKTTHPLAVVVASIARHTDAAMIFV